MAPSIEKGKQISKPVIMLMIDTLMDAPLQEAISHGKAPALKFLKDNGKYYPDIVSPFPTMSVNVDTTLLTGAYCNDHHIPGLVWFSKKENRLINYGSHIRELWKLGLSRSLEDILFHINVVHINKDVITIHEELENKGKHSASINALLYRGNTIHQYKFPMLLKWFTSINENRSTKGPKIFTYGAFKSLSPSFRYQLPWQKYGFNNSFSVQQLIHLIKNDQVPSFTIAYLPDLDKSVHKNGPMDIKGIEKVDQQLQKIFHTFKTWEEALESFRWITIGDNGQAWVDSDRTAALIDLRDLLGSFRIMKLKKGVQPNDQIVLAVNERMAYIYTLDMDGLPTQKLVHTVEHDNRIDIIAWKEGKVIKVRSGENSGEVQFSKNGDYLDPYNQSWLLQGDIELLDITLKDQQIEYGSYPDALARLYSSLHSHEGDFIIVSAKPGYEFIGEGSPTHVGGASHGGLHRQDSLVPMIVTGIQSSPAYLRMVNLKEWILSLIE